MTGRRPLAYYNENDPRAAAWLRELIRARAIAKGVVDERSIEDVRPIDLAGFSQHHFFAGIGGWSAALRLAGWPDHKAVFTGSCPCQPFSQAGERAGFDDERHLWPAFLHIISLCGPPIVFGEQVASAAGRSWLSLVQSDLEGLGYAFGAADLCAAGVGAPHIRQRLYWMGHAGRNGGRWNTGKISRTKGSSSREMRGKPYLSEPTSRMGDAECIGESSPWVNSTPGEEIQPPTRQTTRAANVFPAWREVEWLTCWDGYSRPTQPGIHPLAHGIPARVGLLRGYGNAIVPQLAATFIRAAVK